MRQSLRMLLDCYSDVIAELAEEDVAAKALVDRAAALIKFDKGGNVEAATDPYASTSTAAQPDVAAGSSAKRRRVGERKPTAKPKAKAKSNGNGKGTD